MNILKKVDTNFFFENKLLILKLHNTTSKIPQCDVAVVQHHSQRWRQSHCKQRV